jgi:hypothetical protein
VTATPLPTLPPAPAAPAAPATSLPDAAAPSVAQAAQQPVNLAALVALFIYLAFFGLLGYRRGARRELIVLSVALGSSFLLQRFSDLIVVLFDRFGKGLAFIAGQPIPEQSGLGAWAAANTQTLLILLWLGIVVTTYILTTMFVRKSSKDGWAVLLGVLNGLVFASIFAPLLTMLIFPTATVEGPVVQMPFLGFLGNVWQQLTSLAANLWSAIQPIATNVFFLGIVLLVLLAALTLRTSVRSKS